MDGSGGPFGVPVFTASALLLHLNPASFSKYPADNRGWGYIVSVLRSFPDLVLNNPNSVVAADHLGSTAEFQFQASQKPRVIWLSKVAAAVVVDTSSS